MTTDLFNTDLSQLPTDQLLAHAEQCACSVDDHCDLYWALIGALHLRSDPQIFDTAVEWCQSPEAYLRSLGAQVLGQLGCVNCNPLYPFGAASLPILSGLLDNSEVDVLSSSIIALGHHASHGFLWESSDLAILATHDSVDVRHAVAFALGGDPCDRSDTAVEIMCRLVQDSDHDVRNWAAFGLGRNSDADSPRIRAVLFQCLSDPDDEIRGEAAVGLAKRKDIRVIPVVLADLSQPTVHDLAIEAAAEFPQPQYLVHLEQLLAANPDDYVTIEAVTKCRL